MLDGDVGDPSTFVGGPVDDPFWRAVMRAAGPAACALAGALDDEPVDLADDDLDAVLDLAVLAGVGDGQLAIDYATAIVAAWLPDVGHLARLLRQRGQLSMAEVAQWWRETCEPESEREASGKQASWLPSPSPPWQARARLGVPCCPARNGGEGMGEPSASVGEASR